jgi:hypothetical protein
VRVYAAARALLGSDLRVRRGVEIAGLPNRARVSASARMVAWTTFVGGDSYNSGGFWGVTFTADDNRFHATMSTAGHRYLSRG